MKRALLLGMLWIGMVAVIGMAQEADLPSRIAEASDALTAYEATIEMTRYESRGESRIVFEFAFIPSDRMRIRYTAPESLDGQLMILNGNAFYTYVPSLRREIWQDVDDGSGNQGEEMGFLYDFVSQAVADFLAVQEIGGIEGPSEAQLGEGEAAASVYTVTFTEEGQRQVCWIAEQDFAPVKIEIYDDDILVMAIRVLEYRMNETLDEAVFEIPER